jgi:hypothetical protein
MIILETRKLQRKKITRSGTTLRLVNTNMACKVPREFISMQAGLYQRGDPTLHLQIMNCPLHAEVRHVIGLH